MKPQTPKEQLLNDLKLPRVSFARRVASGPEESRETHIVWDPRTLDQVVKYADRLFQGVTTKSDKGVG